MTSESSTTWSIFPLVADLQLNDTLSIRAIKMYIMQIAVELRAAGCRIALLTRTSCLLAERSPAALPLHCTSLKWSQGMKLRTATVV